MIPNTTTTSTANLKYRAHIYGNDISSSYHHTCSENDIMKMIIEMLRGYTNDLYSHSNRLVAINESFSNSSTSSSSISSSREIRLDDIINLHYNSGNDHQHNSYHYHHHHHYHHSNNNKRRNNDVVDVFQLTFYALHIRVNISISSSLLQSILTWFSRLGSYIFICRKYVQHDCHHHHSNHSNHHRHHNKHHNHNHQQHMKEITYDTLKSMISELLVSIDETLCTYESELNTSSHTNNHHHHQYHQYHHYDATVNVKHLTILRLYQHCQSWLSLFESTSSIVITAYRSYFNRSNVSNDDDDDEDNPTVAAAAAVRDRVNCMVDDLTVKGILQDLTSIAHIGDMCEMIYTPTTTTTTTTTSSTTTTTTTTTSTISTSATTTTNTTTTSANMTNSHGNHDKIKMISKMKKIKMDAMMKKGMNESKNGVLPVLSAKATTIPPPPLPPPTTSSSLLSSLLSSSSDFESNLQMTNINTSTYQLSKNSLFHRFSKLLLCSLLSSILKDLLTMIMKDTGTSTILIDDCNSNSSSSCSYSSDSCDDAVDSVLKSISYIVEDNERRQLRSFLIDMSKLYN